MIMLGYFGLCEKGITSGSGGERDIVRSCEIIYVLSGNESI